MIFARKSVWMLLLLPLLCRGADLDGPVRPAVRVPLESGPLSIPYPDGGVYMPRGIYASLSGGQYRNTGDPQNLYQWQGELGFFYTPWLSGGGGFKMIAGDPSDSSQKIENHFFVFSRVHKSWSQVAAYIGAQVGVNDLNISLAQDSGSLNQSLASINAEMELDLGVGWKFSRYVSATFGQSFEASFVGQDTSLDGSVNFRTKPGLAVDVLAIAPSLRKNVKAFYISLESQFGQLLLENKKKHRDFAGVLGISLGF